MSEKAAASQQVTRARASECIHEAILDMSLALISGATRCRWLGIRVEQEGDFPLVRWQGFSEDFVEKERSLLPPGVGSRLSPEERLARLECACGRVIRGERAWCEELFTPHGSFWVNDLCDTDKIPTSAAREMRGTCLREGCQSFALVPCRPDGRTLLLLHVCDKRKRLLSKRLVARLEETGCHLAELVFQLRELKLAESQPHEAGFKGRRILVVDDEEDMALLVKGMLEAKGHHAAAATSAEQAMEILSRERFDLVVSDVNMPAMSGRLLAAEIRKRWHPFAPPVVLMSGTPSDQMAIGEEGSEDVAGFLAKPFPMEALEATIRATLR